MIGCFTSCNELFYSQKGFRKYLGGAEMSNKPKSKVDIWLERETEHKQKALEKASKHFDKNDALTVNLLEGIYGQESSFGINRGKRGSKDAAGDF